MSENVHQISKLLNYSYIFSGIFLASFSIGNLGNLPVFREEYGDVQKLFDKYTAGYF